MQTTKLSELMAMGPFGFIAFDQLRVNIDDLLDAVSRGPGALVRCEGDPRECIALFGDQPMGLLGCVAGWVSEDEA